MFKLRRLWAFLLSLCSLLGACWLAGSRQPDGGGESHHFRGNRNPGPGRLPPRQPHSWFFSLLMCYMKLIDLWILTHSSISKINPTWSWYAAAAKSLQSCLTLCDPIDGSPSGSPVPGILQARTLEWVVISFSNAWKWKVKVKSLSPVWLLATRWTAAYQAPPSMGFSRQEYWNGVPLLSPDHGIESC